MKVNKFPKLSGAFSRLFHAKQYKITPVPSKPFNGGFEKYLKGLPTPKPYKPRVPADKRVSRVAYKRLRRRYA